MFQQGPGNHHAALRPTTAGNPTPLPKDDALSLPALRGSASPLSLLHTSNSVVSSQRHGLQKTLAECHEVLSRMDVQQPSGGLRGSTASPALVPLPPLGDAVRVAASSQLCRPFARCTGAMWSEATNAVSSLYGVRAVGPPPAATVSPSPGDDDVLAHNLLLDIALGAGASLGGSDSRLSLADADWAIARYIDSVLSSLGAPVPVDRIISSPHHVSGDRPSNGSSAYFGCDQTSGECPSGFYDAMFDAIRASHDGVLQALDKHLSDTLAVNGEGASAALRRYFMSQRALSPKEGAVSVASVVTGVVPPVDGKNPTDEAVDGGDRPLGKPINSEFSTLNAAAKATAAATLGAAALLAVTTAPVGEALTNALGFIKGCRHHRDRVSGGLSRARSGTQTASDAYAAFASQLVYASRDKEKQEGRLIQSLADGADDDEGTAGWGQSSAYGPLVTAAIASLNAKGSAGTTVLEAHGQVPTVGGTALQQHGGGGVDVDALARPFVAMQLLRRLAAVGLASFVNGSSGGGGSSGSLGIDGAPHGTCYGLARARTPQLMQMLGERLRGQQGASRPVVGKARTKGVSPSHVAGHDAPAAAGISGRHGPFGMVPPTSDDPVGHLLSNAVAAAPHLAYYAQLTHYFASSLPAMAAACAGDVDAPAGSSSGQGSQRGHNQSAVPSEQSVAVPLPPPTARPVADLLAALQDRVGDAYREGALGGKGATSEEVLRQQVQRLLYRNASLERENDDLRKSSQMQGQLLQQLSGAASGPQGANPLREMALVQSQLIQTLGDVTATLRAVRNSDASML